MQVSDPDLDAYLRHRLGEQATRAPSLRMIKRALELNAPAPNLSGTFGKRILSAYVGFVDIAGFSTAVQGKDPDYIVAYLEPFLSRAISILRGRGALIDKTIGDELMFVLPAVDEERGAEILFLGQLMGGLYDLAYELEGSHPFRIGLSYGPVRFFRVEGPGYAEWTTAGEPLHVAKRLHSLPELQHPAPVIGAFGMATTGRSLDTLRTDMKARLGMFAGFASRFGHRLEDAPVDLKGVGQVLCAILMPKGGA